MLSRNEKESLFSQHALELQAWVANNLPTLDNVHEIAALSSALPEVEIKDQRAFVGACKKWLRVQQCQQFFKKEKDGIAEFLAENLFVEDWQTESNVALQHLVEHFHLFGGKSRGEFLLWAAQRLRRLPALRNHATLRDFINMGIDDFDNEKPDLPDFKFTTHEMPFGKEYHIPLEDGHVWRVRDLKSAKALWPVHIRKVDGKPYIVKVVQGHTIYVHRLFFKVGIGDTVCAFDDDYTNFSLYPFSRHTEVFWGDWKNPEKTHASKLIRAEGTKPILTELRQEWVPNLYVAHDTARNVSAQDRQDVFEQKNMLQPLEFEDADDGTKKQVDFGGTSSGYLNPVSTSDVVRPLVANKDTPAWQKLDREDKRESEGVQHDMTASAIRDYNRDADQAKYRSKDGDVAGEESQSRESRRNQYEPTRSTLVEDVEAVEEEMVKAEN
jgi:hypothetical protein